MTVKPVTVVYCQQCGLPPEYCKFGATGIPLQRCQKWLLSNHPSLFRQLYGDDKDESQVAQNLEELNVKDDEDIQKQAELEDRLDGGAQKPSRGPKNAVRHDLDETAKEEKERRKREASRVQVKRVERNKRKSVTHVIGLEVFGVDLKKAAKRFASKFACGASVATNPAGTEEIVIQGDVAEEIVDLIKVEFPSVPLSNIDRVADKKK